MDQNEIDERISSLLGFSVEQFRDLEIITHDGIPELIDAVNNEAISIDVARKIAGLPKKAKQLCELSLLLSNKK